MRRRLLTLLLAGAMLCVRIWAAESHLIQLERKGYNSARIVYDFDGNVMNRCTNTAGAISGAPAYVQGKVGQAMRFSGAGDVVSYPLGQWVDRTRGNIQFWYQPDWSLAELTADSASRVLAQLNWGWLLEITKEGKLRHYLVGSGTSNATSGVIPWRAGQWYFIQAVWGYDGGSSIYLNGQLVARDSRRSAGIPDGNLSFYVGNSNKSNAPALGVIDEFILQTDQSKTITVNPAPIRVYNGGTCLEARFDGADLTEAAGAGAVYGEPAFEPAGRFGGAVSFGTANDRISYAASSVFRRSGSLDLSFRPNWSLPGADRYLVSFAEGLGLYVSADGKLILRLFNAEAGDETDLSLASAPVPWEAGQWYQIQAVWSGNKGAELYVDGRRMAFTTQRAALGSGAGELAIGGKEGAFSADGDIDDVVFRASATDESRYTPTAVALQAGLAAPVAVSPSQGEEIAQLPTFVWGQAADAATYTLEYSLSETFAENVKTVSGIASTSYTLDKTEILPSGTWYWRVCGVNEFGFATECSAVRSANVDLSVSLPADLSPDNEEIAGPPTFTWTGGQGIVKYDLEFSKSKDFGSGTISKPLLDASYTVPEGEALLPGIWYWRVQAYNAEDLGSGWTEPASVIVTQSPAGYLLPVDSFEGDTAVWLWNSASGISSGMSYSAEQVADGQKALKINYNFTGNGYVSIGMNRPLTAKPTYLGLKVWVPETEVGRQLSYRLKDEDGDVGKRTIILAQSGWNYLELPVDVGREYGGDGNFAYPRALAEILVEANLKQSGYLYFDQLRAIYKPGEIAYAPDGLCPGSDEALASSPDFSWNQAAEAASYVLEFSKLSNFSASETVTVRDLTDTSYAVPEGQALLPGRWYWRVRSVNANGYASTWSDAESVLIAQTPKGYNLLLDGMEGDLAAWWWSSHASVSGSVGYSSELTHQGSQALRINYDFTNATAGYGSVGLNKPLPGKPQALGMWVYVPPSEVGRKLAYRLRDEDGTFGKGETTLSKSGWNYLEVTTDVAREYGGDAAVDWPRTLVELIVDRNLKTQGFLVVDELRAIHRRGEPAFVQVEVDPEKLPADGSSTAQVAARVTDAAGAAVPDGTEVDFAITAGQITSSGVVAAGVAYAQVTASVLADDEVVVTASCAAARGTAYLNMGEMINWAFAGRGGKINVSSETEMYPRQAANDGRTEAYAWKPGEFWAAGPIAFPQWLEVQLSGPKLIRRIDSHMFQVQSDPWASDGKMTIRDFDLEYFDGTNWRKLGSVKGNKAQLVKYRFQPVVAEKVRLIITGMNSWASARLCEIQVWGPGAYEPPATPQLLGPEPDETVIDGLPVLDWQPASGAQSYLVQLSRQPNFEGAEEFPAAEDSFQAQAALAAGIWYWRVAARDELGILGAFSPARSFTVSAVQSKAAPELLYPKRDGLVLERQPRFQWQAVEGAAGYVLEYTVQDNFNNDSVTRVQTQDAFYAPQTELEVAVTYNWRVRALDESGNFLTAFCEAAGFSVVQLEAGLLSSHLRCAPNPFRIRQGAVRISYLIGGETTVTIKVYNLAGKLVRTVTSKAWRLRGYYEEVWDGRDQNGRAVLAGPYIVQLEARTGGQKVVLRQVIVAVK